MLNLIFIFANSLQVSLGSSLFQRSLSVTSVNFITFDAHQLLAIQRLYASTSNRRAKIMPSWVRSNVLYLGDRALQMVFELVGAIALSPLPCQNPLR